MLACTKFKKELGQVDNVHTSSCHDANRRKHRGGKSFVTEAIHDLRISLGLVVVVVGLAVVMAVVVQQCAENRIVVAPSGPSQRSFFVTT